ncbi:MULTISPECIES: MMPL family transporter [Streptomyces]|uniref:MMPL family transporter n=2 Tax=Streptomyces TaxID=1883 RepID=A0ABU3JD77_9ACTN|nr:MMPL family transporter [Streptomyces sp. McG7]MBT2903191.1 MMPL family transporter [Streptomyces sp. McG8]MDQ0491000.1 RND superfamily putative drug exporter [Streptomyces thermodiastaticus]MDT6973009.1 MMPL family transporter [Streptomyces thermocarboxydus]MDX3418417.1 MMPL family transporter [Streptomyces sp. MD20-1-1]MXQ62260.1 MMPL family transporter [Streptomyces sp. XHT-2]MYQ33012.1 MMPL family transporter [Streptomyces sp. SID4956]MYW55307.1 MMPL family transporter [Streptomyces s
MAALARWCVQRRLFTVLLWLLALVGIAAGAFVAGSAYSNDYKVPGTESGHAAELMKEGFPSLGGDSDSVVWHTASGTVRDSGVEQTMTRTLDRLEELPGVASVSGPYDDGGAGRISADGRTAYATVTFEHSGKDITSGEAEAVVKTAKAAETDGLDVELGGSAVELSESSGGHTAEIVGVAVAAVVLFLAFGSLAASLLPIATALVSVGTAYAGIVLLGHVMTVADFAPMLGMLIGLGVGIDYALFIVTRHRRGLKRGLSVTEAATNAVATTGRAVVFAGATVCIALLGMLILRLNFLNGVAVAASLTVVLTVAASVTLLPALLSLIGTRALSRRERRRLAEHGPEPEMPTGFAARWSAFVERHPKLLGAVAVVVMAVLALPTFSLHLGTSDQGNDPKTSTTRQAYDLIADGFGPGVNGPLTLVTEVDDAQDRLALDNLGATLRTTEDVASVSPVTYSQGGDTAFLTVVPESSPQSKQTSDLVDRLREDVLPRAESGTSLDVHVGGVTAGYDDFASVIVAKLPLFVGVVIGLGCLLLLLAFRSIGIPLKAAAMNVAAVAGAFGVVVMIFQWGWGSDLLGLGSAGPVEPFLPVIMVSVLFGLSMDYQVFLVSRMYEEWLETGDNRRAVRVGLAETSRVINSAAVIMISVFLAFVLSGDRVIAMFGIALAAAVALDAFVLRTLLVPALMHLLGGANWWLPKWLDRILPRISIEPPECRAAHERLAAVTDAGVADVLAEEERQRDVRDTTG